MVAEINTSLKECRASLEHQPRPDLRFPGSEAERVQEILKAEKNKYMQWREMIRRTKEHSCFWRWCGSMRRDLMAEGSTEKASVTLESCLMIAGWGYADSNINVFADLTARDIERAQRRRRSWIAEFKVVKPANTHECWKSFRIHGPNETPSSNSPVLKALEAKKIQDPVCEVLEAKNNKQSIFARQFTQRILTIFPGFLGGKSKRKKNRRRGFIDVAWALGKEYFRGEPALESLLKTSQSQKLTKINNLWNSSELDTHWLCLRHVIWSEKLRQGT